MGVLVKTIADEKLQSAGVYDLDPATPLIASQAAILLGRSKTRMDGDRRDGKPPQHYPEGRKVLYPLGAVLAERARSQGITPEQARQAARDRAMQGEWSFNGFMAAGTTGATWPIAQVQGLPMDYFATLGMDLEDDDLGEPKDLTRDEFVRSRVAFFQERPKAWGIAPTAIGEEWARNLEMATSLTEGWDKGYQQALQVLVDDAKADGRVEQRERKRQREALEHSGDYQGVRKALDAAPDELHMTRFTAQFYLGMSPGVFKKALARGPHPFAEPKGGATKGEVDKWFEKLVKDKHAEQMPDVRPLRVSRDLSTGRPYLVDVSGAILADGHISNIDPADVAYAASLGAGIRILSLSSALAMPWRDPVERQAWAGWRQFVLAERVHKADVAMADAQVQDMKAGNQRPLRPGEIDRI